MQGVTPVPIPNTEVKLLQPMILLSGKVGYRRLYGPRQVNPGEALFVFPPSASPGSLSCAAQVSKRFDVERGQALFVPGNPPKPPSFGTCASPGSGTGGVRRSLTAGLPQSPPRRLRIILAAGGSSAPVGIRRRVSIASPRRAERYRIGLPISAFERARLVSSLSVQPVGSSCRAHVQDLRRQP